MVQHYNLGECVVIQMRYVYFLRCSICSIRQGGYKARRISRESSLAHVVRTRSPTKRLGHRPNPCLCRLCGPSLGKQEATILWNKFPLIWACWSWAPVGRLLSGALPACPTDQPSLPFTVPTHCKSNEMLVGGFGAVGILALPPWTAHVCSQQASVLPWRKELSGEELAQDWLAPTCILTANTTSTTQKRWASKSMNTKT